MSTGASAMAAVPQRCQGRNAGDDEGGDAQPGQEDTINEIIRAAHAAAVAAVVIWQHERKDRAR